jgi:hypothetical protein
MKTKVIGIALGILYAQVTFAGLFGPSNFEECVLEKMKGQAPSLMYMARAACKKAFPGKPVETVIENDRIKYEWCKSEYESEAVCIEKKPENVEITKVEALFFEDACDAKQAKSGITVTAEKPWFGSTYKFALPFGNRKCAYFRFYGIEK